MKKTLQIIDDQKGFYILVLNLARSKKIQVGKLGEFDFGRGVYLYVGSAKNGIARRVNRHLRSKIRKWHIDFLKNHAKITGVLIIPEDNASECEIAKIVGKNYHTPIKGFGSSDCRCDSHLFYAEESENCVSKTRKVIQSSGIKCEYLALL